MSVNRTERSMPDAPTGKMSIENVFKMMWGRMNYLENKLETTDTELTNSKVTPTSIADLKNSPVGLSQEQIDGIESLKTTQEELERSLSDILVENKLIKERLEDTINTFNSSIKAIGADLIEMNNKYTQMNNFLMEIQTTQITVNNKILRHYNETLTTEVEQKIEESASIKFNADQVTTAETGTETGTGTETETETAPETVAEMVADNDTETTVVAADNVVNIVSGEKKTLNLTEGGEEKSKKTEKKSNNVTFNIE